MASWTTPRTWVTGEVVTASIMNTHVRDNLTYLYDRASTASSQLSGNVDLTVADTWYNGPSFSIAAGTWVLFASVNFAPTGAGARLYNGRIWDGTTTFASGEASTSGTQRQQLALTCKVTPTGTTTYTFQGLSSIAGDDMLAAIAEAPVGNNASTMVGIRVLV